MTTTINDFPDVATRAKELGCVVPEKFAVLPRNFLGADSIDDLVHESNTATVRTLLRNERLTETPIEPEGKKFPYAQENDFTWVGPIIFFTAAQLTENSNLVSVSLSVLANYLTDFFRGMTGQRKIKVDIVVEQTKTKKHVHVQFEGDMDGFKELPNTILELVHNERVSSTVSKETE